MKILWNGGISRFQYIDSIFQQFPNLSKNKRCKKNLIDKVQRQTILLSNSQNDIVTFVRFLTSHPKHAQRRFLAPATLSAKVVCDKKKKKKEKKKWKTKKKEVFYEIHFLEGRWNVVSPLVRRFTTVRIVFHFKWPFHRAASSILRLAENTRRSSNDFLCSIAR